MSSAIYEHQRVPGAAVPQVDRDTLNLEVSSARFGLKVEVLDWVSLVLEGEFAGNVKLRDGFVQAKRKHWAVRGGQFKMPISVFTLESPWQLPLARRGWLHELLSDHMLLSGRREGFQAQALGGGSLDPALTVGAFRSIQWGTDAGDAIPNPGLDDQTLVARLSVTPKGIEVAAVGQRRVTVVQQPRGLLRRRPGEHGRHRVRAHRGAVLGRGHGRHQLAGLRPHQHRHRELRDRPGAGRVPLRRAQQGRAVPRAVRHRSACWSRTPTPSTTCTGS